MPKAQIFYLANMSFNAVRKNKIIVKIYDFTVSSLLSSVTVLYIMVEIQCASPRSRG